MVIISQHSSGLFLSLAQPPERESERGVRPSVPSHRSQSYLLSSLLTLLVHSSVVQVNNAVDAALAYRHSRSGGLRDAASEPGGSGAPLIDATPQSARQRAVRSAALPCTRAGRLL